VNASSNLILITLLVELGVAAAVASSLARSVTFKRLLLEPHRSRRDSLKLIAMVCVPLMLGVWIRVRVPNFLAADLAFEATILLALLMGPLAAIAGAVLLAVPAVLHHEYLALPVNLLVAAVAGAFGRFADPEDVWSFSPMIDLSIYRWVTRNLRRPQLDRQILLLVLVASMQFGTSLLAQFHPRYFYALHSDVWWVELLICATAPIIVGIPLKIWNAVRVERKLEEQGRLLLEARLDALQRQINPHFLFNTLNSAIALVREDPARAETMLEDLSDLFRHALADQGESVTLAEEIALAKRYLAIEQVRFGERLRVEWVLDSQADNARLPPLLLQPLVENAVRHGVEPSATGAQVKISTQRRGTSVVIKVTNTVSAPGRPGNGVALDNVRDRLNLLHDVQGQFQTALKDGVFQARIEVPA